MRLSKFIRENETNILREWQRYAAELHSAPGENHQLALREHSRIILDYIAQALDSPKVANDAQDAWRAISSRSQERVPERAADSVGPGFEINDLLVEFVALRASVLRLWPESASRMHREDVLHFNIAIDLLFTEAIKQHVQVAEAQSGVLEAIALYSSGQFAGRRQFDDRLEQDIRLARRMRSLLGVLYIDLDKFQESTAQLAQEDREGILQQVERRIGSCIRDTDTVASMGGDRFAVTLMDAGDDTHVEAVARAIQARLSRPFSVTEKTLRISGSVGIALFPQHGETAHELVVHAEYALQSAKDKGGDCIRFFTRFDPIPRQPRITLVTKASH